MSSEWQEYQLAEIADLNGGYAFKSAEYVDSGCFVLRTVNITNDGRVNKEGAVFVSLESVETYQRFLLEDLDTLFVMVGATLGKTGLVRSNDLPALLNQNMWVIRGKKNKVDPLFLHYSFKHSSESMRGLVSGSARGFFKRDDFRKMTIRMPSIAKQEEISTCLGCLDNRITLLRETNKTLESIAQAIFKSWFVDFDPVRAKMEGRQPEGMDEETAALFPDLFEESGLGLTPRGWATDSFYDTIQIIGGGTPKTSNPDYWGGEIPWYSVVDAPVGADTFVMDTEKKITEAGLKGSSTKLLPPGTTIISARGTVGKLALTGCEIAMNQSCYGLRGLDNENYFTYFSTKRLVDTLKQQAHGSVFDTITQATFKGVITISPPLKVRLYFENSVKYFMELILTNLTSIKTLTELRETLLPRLISGQLRLPEAQAIVEEHSA